MNTEQCHTAADPQTEPINLGLKSACKPLVYMHQCYLLSPKTYIHFTIPQCGRRINLGTAVLMCSKCARLYTAVASCDKHTNCPLQESIPGSRTALCDRMCKKSALWLKVDIHSATGLFSDSDNPNTASQAGRLTLRYAQVNR